MSEDETLQIFESFGHIKLNKSEVADLLGVSTRTLDRKIDKGEVPCGRKDVGDKNLYWYRNEILNIKEK